jgi:prepilin-type N-terminal cleavage/methylation domain-containing protein
MKKRGFTLIELLIVVAIIAILAAIAVPNFLEAQVRSKVSRVKTDLRSLTTGVESYFVDHNLYPSVDSSDEQGTSGFGINALAGASGNLVQMPTFRRKQNGGDRLFTLTSPRAYITSYFEDVFAKTPGATFAYSTPQESLDPRGNAGKLGWIMWSFGPDFDESGGMQGGDILFSAGEGVRIDTAYYNPNQLVPSPTLTDQGTYDPTNGTTSNGDVWRTRP